ncbi:MAG: sigma-70 family RNA polymerase sigma factor [Planctomycetes bacterium]|nr:sigma-70 family RNA polymerase sigma factor [Planctomycetota bacterium]
MQPGPDDLLVRFQAGDAAAFDQLVSEMGPRLKGYFLRQGAQNATAEDLTQLVFVRVFQARQRYKSSGRLDAYLLRIAHNLWIDSRRRKRFLTGGDDLPDAVDSSPGPAEEAVAGDRASVLRAALGRLPVETRELLELAVLQRLPYQEVSEILDIPVGTVKSRVYYSLRKLRDKLAVLEPEADQDGTSSGSLS